MFQFSRKVFPSNPDLFCFPSDGSVLSPRRPRVGLLCLLRRKGYDQHLPPELFRRNVAKLL